MTVMEWIAIGTLVINLGMVAIGLKIRADMGGIQIGLERQIEQGDAELKEHMREVELYMRDNFVRKASFDKVVDMMTTQMAAQFDRLQQSIDRLNDKIDRQNGHTG